MSATSQVSAANKCHSEQPRRTPRPPNAFFLYRSDFLKRRAIPPEVEKRQQNLSRIAGQCWNMLPETEKAIWHSKAAIVRAEYLVRYPPNGTGPFPKDTNRLLAKAKRRGSVNNPRRPSGRSRGRRTQPPYYEGLLTTQHDSTFSSPTSQASLISTPAPKSPLSTTAALSPPLLSHGLPSFASHTNSSSQDSLLATTENSIRNEIDDPLGPLVFEAPQGVSYTTRDSENTPSEIGPCQEPPPALQPYEDSLGTCVPFTVLKQHPTLYGDPTSQLPRTLLETATFSPAWHDLADCQPLATYFGVTDNVTHFNQPPLMVPLYS